MRSMLLRFFVPMPEYILEVALGVSVTEWIPCPTDSNIIQLTGTHNEIPPTCLKMSLSRWIHKTKQNLKLNK